MTSPAAAPPRGRVLVTGASGFVGSWLCEHWARAGGAVRGLVRDPAAALPAGVEPAPVRGLDDAAGLRRAVEGVDAVVHLAARVHVMRDAAADPLGEFRRVNVEGTRALLAAAREAGVGRFVLASSVKAVGEATPHGPWTEATPPAPVDPYGVSKLEAEGVVRGEAGEVGATVLRLPLVYGPGVKGNMHRLFTLVSRGVPLPLGGVRNRRSLLFVGNLAAAVERVLAVRAAAGETFFVSDGEDLSTPALVRLIARALGRPARLIPVPEAAFRAAGRAGDLLARAVPGVPLTSAAADRLLGSLALDAAKLARVTGFSAPYTVEAGIRATAEWFGNSLGR